jgi:hypothetical protein
MTVDREKNTRYLAQGPTSEIKIGDNLLYTIRCTLEAGSDFPSICHL